MARLLVPNIEENWSAQLFFFSDEKRDGSLEREGETAILNKKDFLKFIWEVAFNPFGGTTYIWVKFIDKVLHTLNHIYTFPLSDGWNEEWFTSTDPQNYNTSQEALRGIAGDHIEVGSKKKTTLH